MLREAAQQKQVWYDKQLEHERQNTQDVEIRLNNEMSRLEGLHQKESQIWSQMKMHYEEATAVNKRKIENLKKALEDLQACTHFTWNVSAPSSTQNVIGLWPNSKRPWTEVGPDGQNRWRNSTLQGGLGESAKGWERFLQVERG